MQESDSGFEEYFALREEGDFRGAYAVLREMLANSPRLSKVGDLYVWCAEFELLVNDNVREAQELLNKARELGLRQEAPYYRQHGYVLWRLGEREKGIQEVQHSVELNSSVTYLGMLAKLLTEDKDEQAETIWRRVLDQDPENCSAHVYLGIAAAKSGSRAQALLMARRAATLNPTAADMLEIGRLYGELSLFQDALGSYLAADRLGYEPKGPLCAAAAQCCFHSGQVDSGRKYIEWALRHSPENDYVKDICEKYRNWMGGE